MLFNSYTFIFLFLPVVYAGFFGIARVNPVLAALWLVLASLFFYGWWNPAFVPLLVASIGFNYGMGSIIATLRPRASAKSVTVAAIAVNLAVLAYFKYTNFFISTAGEMVGVQIPLAQVVLPLGISFFTFTQIMFLVDVYRGTAREHNLVHYAVFVSYFPHLIAGPLLHHKQIIPQFALPQTYRFNIENLAIGLTIFTVGLAKKVLLADNFGDYAAPIFDSARDGLHPQFMLAWTGAVAYSLQLYFDFSGYSDMAIGLSRLFGVRLPLNFNSPYKAHNIIEFWRRWHMTLSQFLRSYLYIPLGGNRRGRVRRYVNLVITMLLGGLWHGAGWTFVFWGGLHALYLICNHAWHELRGWLKLSDAPPSVAGHVAAVAVTYLAVVVAWVFFRAESFSAALDLLQAMAGLGTGAGDFDHDYLSGGYRRLATVLVMIPVGLIIVMACPNTQSLVDHPEQQPGEAARWAWRPAVYIGLAAGAVFGLAIAFLSRPTEFLYFQF